MRRHGLNFRKFLLRFTFPFLKRLEPRKASRSLSAIGRWEYRNLASVRLRFDRAVEAGKTHFHADWDVVETARELAGYHIRFRTRDLLLDGLDDQRARSVFEVEGRDHLDAALAGGKGVILLSNHYGGNLMQAHWMIREGYTLRMYMERPRRVSRLMAEHFDQDGPLGQKKMFISRKMEPAEAAAAVLKASKALRAGMVVMMASDVQWIDSHTAEVVFLGGRFRFSTTWVTLAAMSGAPVVQVFSHLEPDGASRLEFLPAISVPSEALRADPTPWMRQALGEIEQRVAASPLNSNDYFFWLSDPDLSVSAAALQHPERH